MDRKKVKILAVCKSRMLRAIIRENLKRVGYDRINVADSGETAMHWVRSEPPHVIISDFDLPDMNGLELLKYVREDPSLKDLAFIMIAADSEEKFVARAGEYRVSAYIVKPFPQQTLVDKLDRVLEQLINPSEGVLFYQEANKLAAAGNYEAALARYKQALEATSYSMAAVYHKIGWANEQLEKNEKAEINYTEAVDRCSRFVDAYDSLGRLNLKMAQPAKALEFLRQGAEISPMNPMRQKHLGDALLANGDSIGAEEAYRTALKIDPQCHIALGNLGMALELQGKLEEAQELLLKAVEETQGSDEKLHYCLGRIYYQRGFKATAMRHLEKAVEIKSDFEEARELLEQVKRG